MSRTLSLGVVFAVVSGAAAFYGCSSDAPRSGFGGEGTSSGNTSGSGGILGGGGDSGGGGKGCVPNPANYDIPGNNCDDDGDGKIDNPPTCDGSLSESGSADDFAKAIGVCASASKDGYGLVKAEYLKGYNVSGAPQAGQHGILSKFGSVLKPREGAKLGVLSSGYAREFDALSGTSASFMKNAQKWDGVFGQAGSAPPGFPKPAAGCAISDEIHDVINVKLTLKAPQNASGVKFDFNFFSSEWPAFICSEFNDGFIAFLSAKGFNNGTADNISFDKDKNPVSVNNGFFDRCTPNVDTGCAPGAKPGTSVCPGGPGELAGTGYGIEDKYCQGAGGNDTSTGGGATGWLTSQAPVQAGEEFTLEFMIWDTGDSDLDSSVLIDNFTWVEGAVTTATDRPPR